MRKTKPIFRVLAIVLILASLGMVFLPWMSMSAFGYTETVSFFDLIQEFVDEIGYGLDFITENTRSLLLSIATILFVITAILAIILAACGVRGGGVPFFISSLLCLGVFIYLVSLTNKQMHTYYGLNVASLGIGAILCPVFALAAMILLFIPNQAKRGAYAGGYGAAPARPTTWICPNCGTILADRERFCPNCGNSRAMTAATPAPTAVRRCGSCGATLEKGASFCPNCGSPVGGARPAAPTYTAPRTPSYPTAPTYTAPTAPRQDAPVSNGGFHTAGDEDL